MIQKSEVFMCFSDQDIKKITEIPLFKECDPTTFRSVLNECGCQIRTFADGEILRSPEDTDRVAGVILKGKATVTTPDTARNTLLRFLGKGEMFGIANLFSEAPYISVIRANGECRAFLLPEQAIRQLLERDTAFLYRYLGFLSGRIRFLNQKIGYLTAGSAERRLALYLRSLGKGSVHLDESISSLSELLDVGRASLYRAFDKLTEDGFIQKQGRSFTLLDPEGMLKAYQ
jgi:CRP-like cAMP-binding protein